MDETFRIGIDEQDEGKGKEKQDQVEISLYIQVQTLSEKGDAIAVQTYLC